MNPGRWNRSGCDNPRAVLTEAHVVELRKYYAHGAEVADLATRYRVSPTTIIRALTGRNWRHVPGAVRMRARRRRTRP